MDDLLDVARIAHGEGRREAQRRRHRRRRRRRARARKPAPRRACASPRARRRAWVAGPGGPASVGAGGHDLVVNAAKYTDNGGHIRVSAAEEDGSIVVRVSDDGIGMTPEALGRVFDVFEQGRRAIHCSNGGLGLGLAIVRGIVHAHGGRATARSDGPGAGASSRSSCRAPARPR